MHKKTIIKVIVNGAKGRMGSETVKAISDDPELDLVASLGRQDNLAGAIQSTRADCVVDLTCPTAVYANTKMIIENNAHPIIGTTGLTPEQIKECIELCARKKLGGLIAPNFSLGAVLMMQFAKQAAEYFPDVEIIEMHHEKKLDAPSGTALKTAELIAENSTLDKTEIHCKESHAGALGAKYQSIPIHSIRLPGLVAHQQVMFGGHSETLTIRHDSIHRQSFMPGILMACKKTPKLDTLVYGLECIL